MPLSDPESGEVTGSSDTNPSESPPSLDQINESGKKVGVGVVPPLPFSHLMSGGTISTPTSNSH